MATISAQHEQQLRQLQQQLQAQTGRKLSSATVRAPAAGASHPAAAVVSLPEPAADVPAMLSAVNSRSTRSVLDSLTRQASTLEPSKSVDTTILLPPAAQASRGNAATATAIGARRE